MFFDLFFKKNLKIKFYSKEKKILGSVKSCYKQFSKAHILGFKHCAGLVKILFRAVSNNSVEEFCLSHIYDQSIKNEFSYLFVSWFVARA